MDYFFSCDPAFVVFPRLTNHGWIKRDKEKADRIVTIFFSLFPYVYYTVLWNNKITFQQGKKDYGVELEKAVVYFKPQRMFKSGQHGKTKACESNKGSNHKFLTTNIANLEASLRANATHGLSPERK